MTCREDFYLESQPLYIISKKALSVIRQKVDVTYNKRTTFRVVLSTQT
jgi:hypothetical protein